MLAWSCAAQALSVGDMTYFMGSGKDYLVREVVNDSDQTRVYGVSVEESAPPYGDVATWKPKGGDLMYAPKQLVLRPNMSGWLRLYFKGVSDDSPRYFRVTFREERAASIDTDAVKVKPRLELQTILVVQPRSPRQAYRVDGTLFVNSGNTVMLVTAHGECTLSIACMRDRYLSPGESLDLAGLNPVGGPVRVVLANGTDTHEVKVVPVNQFDRVVSFANRPSTVLPDGFTGPKYDAQAKPNEVEH
ncbi:hypothetical protein WS50_08725 [Burkholderia territorii]|uniref:hypothetical protein n=1 Tax=Burkholderia territorii TaxID=1503055 RepID=UPI000754ACFC|nr:hypothetical protein [Burkholderia territorii]KUZ21055.1 hypothetical protein WS50_08725 [Burkholderia territorii]